MLTQKIDGALDAILACMMRVPALRDAYRPGTPERAALDDLLASLQRADAVLFHRGPDAPSPAALGAAEAPGRLQPWLERRT
ncbi:hypothetical protein [Phenylobacterium montanum]|uniref:Uncharacterized protein n=1 Tax=Phenylobacterium montanum TaxID=2823693 RepID=A0A975G2T1_9CAUL|nr:hypothetical protein [Caulobacter sp. S6]QUD89845.1 hypothetical protein KCG34_08240 [Caulobacter sp. S6]